jgi:hypothetical protein
MTVKRANRDTAAELVRKIGGSILPRPILGRVRHLATSSEPDMRQAVKTIVTYSRPATTKVKIAMRNSFGCNKTTEYCSGLRHHCEYVGAGPLILEGSIEAHADLGFMLTLHRLTEI